MSSMFFNYISDQMINPNDVKVSENNYYPLEIAERVSNYLGVVVLIFIFVGICVITFLFPVRDEKLQSDKRMEYLTVIRNKIFL